MSSPPEDTGRGRRWTIEEIDTLTRMLEADQSTPAMAAALDRTSASIRAKARDLGYRAPANAVRDANLQMALLTNKELRTELERKALLAARKMVDMIDQPFTAFSFGGKDNTYREHRMDEPPTEAQRALAQTFQTYIAAADRIAAAGEDKLNMPDVDAWILHIRNPDIV